MVRREDWFMDVVNLVKRVLLAVVVVGFAAVGSVTPESQAQTIRKRSNASFGAWRTFLGLTVMPMPSV